MADYAARRVAMVDTQVRPSDVTKFPIIEAMLSVAKEDFVPDSLRQAAYVGENIILPGGRTILEPRTMGKMLDALNIQPNETVLDLGSGYGYSSALVAHLCEAVVAVESDADMVTDAQARLSSAGADNAAVLEGSLVDGNAKNAPYDVIVIQGGVEQIPDTLVDQLRDGGRIGAIFMDGALGACKIGTKSNGQLSWNLAFNAAAPVIEGFERQVAFSL